MNNKKLLKILFKDLTDLEDLFEDAQKSTFTPLEMEFLRARLKGMKGMVEILESQEVSAPEIPTGKAEPGSHAESEEIRKPKVEKVSPPAATGKEKVKIEEPEDVPESTFQETHAAEEVQPETPVAEATSHETTSHETTSIHEDKKIVSKPKQAVQPEEKKKRLGDSFSKEQSVNDSHSADNIKLEHKLSSRPVASIQSAIGINDKFQYIRELFEGNADAFAKAVMELDTRNNIEEATQYIRENFNWEKNETSLKFVHLIKRRFPHE